jgi:diamine N-acetyltransferase
LITLRNIDYSNFLEIIDLKVYENQLDFLTSNAVSIAQSKVQPECIPLAIYNDEKAVGFAMHGIDRRDEQHWIYRFMIDRRYQSKGFGKAALKLLIDQIQKDKTHNKILLGVHKESIAAIKLYRSLGFEFNGHLLGKEHIMELSY